jgi:hypothetical protein
MLKLIIIIPIEVHLLLQLHMQYVTSIQVIQIIKMQYN